MSGSLCGPCFWPLVPYAVVNRKLVYGAVRTAGFLDRTRLSRAIVPDYDGPISRSSTGCSGAQ